MSLPIIVVLNMVGEIRGLSNKNFTSEFIILSYFNKL